MKLKRPNLKAMAASLKRGQPKLEASLREIESAKKVSRKTFEREITI